MTPEAVLTEAVRQGAFPGGQLAASCGGRRLTSMAVGTLCPGGDETHPEVIYDLASLTKPLATATLIGRAVDRGEMGFGDPLAQYLAGVHPRVTLAHALDHSAGYPAHIRFDARLPASIRPGSWAAFHHIVEDVAQVPLDAAPETRALYSDLGFILLGAALETFTHEPLSQSFDALGTALFFRDRRDPEAALPVPSKDARFAPTEHHLEGIVHDDNARAMGGAAGHAGLFGTAEGVLEVCESLLRAWHGDEGELLSPEVVRRMWRPSTVPASTRTLGWDRPSPGRSSAGAHWPAEGIGHLGFTGTSVWIDPEAAFVVVLVTNRVCPTRTNEAIRQIRPALHDAARATWLR